MLNLQELQLMHQGYIWRVVSSLWLFVAVWTSSKHEFQMEGQRKDKFSGNSYHLFKSQDFEGDFVSTKAVHCTLMLWRMLQSSKTASGFKCCISVIKKIYIWLPCDKLPHYYPVVEVQNMSSPSLLAIRLQSGSWIPALPLIITYLNITTGIHAVDND